MNKRPSRSGDLLYNIVLVTNNTGLCTEKVVKRGYVTLSVLYKKKRKRKGKKEREGKKGKKGRKDRESKQKQEQ